MSIPVFVAPAHPQGAVVIAGERLAGSVFHFSLTNPANAHVRLTVVAVKGIGPDAKEIFSKSLTACTSSPWGAGSTSFPSARPSAPVAPRSWSRPVRPRPAW